MGEIRNAYTNFVVIPEMEETAWKTRRRWEINIRMDFGRRGWDGADRMHLAQDRDQWWDFVNTVMNVRVA
jgi:hypothetical protein